MTQGLLKKIFLGLAVGLVIALATSIFTAATAKVSLSYAITNLGSLGGKYSEALGINDAGLVVGKSSLISGSKYQAFLWKDGTLNYLLPNAFLIDQLATDINNIGQIACNYLPMGHVVGKNAFVLWSQNGKIVNIDPPGETNSIAHSINDKGQVAVWTSGGSSYLWQQGNKILLGSLGGIGGSISSAYGINNAGQVVGYSKTTSGLSHAFLWEEGKMKDLGTLGGDYSEARSINKAAQVVGSSRINNSSSVVHAFLWEKRKMKDLRTLGGNNSQAFAINNLGTIVGKSQISSGIEHAFVWKHGKITDLNSFLPANSGWELTVANAINNRGQIVGKGTFNGETRAFLLTPVMVTN